MTITGQNELHLTVHDLA